MNKILFTLLIPSICVSSIYANPGDHVSFTCPEYRVPAQKSCTQANSDFNNPINIDCLTHREAPGIALVNVFGDSTMAQDMLFLQTFAETGNPTFSWNYFYNTFGNLSPNVQVYNLGASGSESGDLLAKLIGATAAEKYNPADITNNDILNSPSCAAARDTAIRSVVGIGGNDSWRQRIGTLWLPFLSKQINKRIIKNLRLVIDWHLENGKSILLDGTSPLFPNKKNIPLTLDGYNSQIVTRASLCSTGPTVPTIKPPWLVLIPGFLQAYLAFTKLIFNSWIDFGKALYYKNAPLTPPNDDKGVAWALWTTTSMDLACLNDRLQNEIERSYASYLDKSGNPRVRVNTVYNSFTGMVDGYNFWMSDALYWQKQNQKLSGDPAHYGFEGYKLRGRVTGTKLGQLGWNNFADKNSAIAIDAKRINEIGLLINARARLEEVPDDVIANSNLEYLKMNGSDGYKKEFGDITIYLQNSPSASTRVLSGTIRDAYRPYEGISGRTLGFPVSEIYLTQFNTIFNVDFECGRIFDNTLDFLQRVRINWGCGF